MKIYDLIFVSLLIIISFLFLSALHNIDNIFNMVRLEQTNLQENNMIIENMPLLDLYNISITIITVIFVALIFICLGLYYDHANRRTYCNRTIHGTARQRT